MKPRCAALALVFMVLASASADAQQKGGKGKAPTPAQVRYFDLSGVIFNELGSEAILKENRQGATVVAAELDVCHPSAPASNRLDRFVVPLKLEGNRLTGTGQSQEGKLAVSVNLLRRAVGGSVSFEGTVTSGTNTSKVQAGGNTELSEEEITEQYLSEGMVEPAPADFTAAWPQVLYARVARDALPRFLEALREQNVRLVYNTLQMSCRLLRSGRYTVQIDADAERVGAVRTALKAIPGVSDVGFSPSPPNMQRAVRFPSAGWRDASGRLERDKLAATIAKAMAGAMAATVIGTAWDPVLGELTVEMKRPDETIAGLKLAQQITVTVVVAPESLTSNAQSILWIESVSARVFDERAPPRLTFTMAQSEEEGGLGEPAGSEALPEAVARALKGVPWDAEAEQWQQ